MVQLSSEDLTASEYIERFADNIAQGVKEQVGAARFSDHAAFVRWRSDGGSFATAVVSCWADGNALLPTLRAAVAPDLIEHMVDRGRRRGTLAIAPESDPSAVEIWMSGDGVARWFPDVAVEVANRVTRAFTASLKRIMPRYVVAAVQTRLRVEQQSDQCVEPTQVPEPDALDIIPSHPIDRFTIDALCQPGGLTDVDHDGYLAAHPGPSSEAEPGRLRPLSIQFEAPQGAWYWLRVISPSDATAEEVANELYGDPAYAHHITAAAPLFGFANAHRVLERHKQTLRAYGSDPGARPSPEYADAPAIAGTSWQPFDLDPTAEILAGPLSEEAALAQAGEGNGRTRIEILQDMRQAHDLLVEMGEAATVFGLQDRLTAQIGRLDDRSRCLADSDAGELQRWDAQAASQRQIIGDAASGLRWVVERYREMVSQIEEALSTCQVGARPRLPDHVRRPMYECASKFVLAASSSDLVTTARERLREAEEDKTLFPIMVMEGILSQVQSTVDEAMEAKRQNLVGAVEHGTYGVDSLRQREESLRARLGELRMLLLNAPGAVGESIMEIYREVSELQSESDIVGNMDALDAAWQALEDTNGFWATVTFDDDDLEGLQSEGRRFHARWRSIHDHWKEGNHEAARADLEALRQDPALASYLGRVNETIEDARVAAAIAQVAALLVITVVTIGAGAWAAGAAAGLELTAGGALAFTAGVEALTFTTLQTLVFNRDTSAQGFLGELAFNFALFGTMRRFSAMMEGVKLARSARVGLELTGQAVILEAFTLARAEVVKYAERGEHLTEEEVTRIAVEGLMMFAVVAIIGRMAQPILTRLQGMGTALGVKIRAANRARLAIKTQAEALEGNRDMAEAIELIRRERLQLEKELEIYNELEKQALQEEANPPRNGEGILDQAGLTRAQLSDMQSSLTTHSREMKVVEMMMSLERIGPDHFAVPRERIPSVLRDLEGEVVGEAIDPVTQLQTYEVRIPDGVTVRLTEKVAGDVSPEQIRTARAQERVTELEALPGTGSRPTATGDRATLLGRAKEAAGEGAEATAVLDALRPLLPEEARVGLDTFRTEKPDARVLAQFEGMSRGAVDIVHYLVGQGLTPAQRSALQARIFDAHVELARAKLAEFDVINDPMVRDAISAEARALIDSLGSTPDQASFEAAVRGRNVTELIAEITEAMGRADLQSRFAGPEYRVLSNLEVVEEVPGFATINEWKAASPENTDVGGLYEAQGKLWKSITEQDLMVVRVGEDGRLRPHLLEQVKSGTGEGHADAMAQNNKTLSGLRRIAAGDETVQIFERPGKNTLGERRTGDFDLTNLDGVQTETRGLPGKSDFTSRLDIGENDAGQTRELMDHVARLLLAEQAVRLVNARDQASSLDGTAPGLWGVVDPTNGHGDDE